MARSGCILDHAKDENGNQSRGKGPKARTSFACFCSAIFWPVLVVPLNTTSIFGSVINGLLAKGQNMVNVFLIIVIKKLLYLN